MTQFRQLLLACGVTLLAYQATAQSVSRTRDGNNALIGAWLIVETTITTSDETTVIENPQPGLYIFTERHFSTMLVPGESRELFSAARTADERLAAYDNFVADAGTYKLQDSTLITDNIIAKIPNGMEARISYRYSFNDGDLLLTLEGAWAPPGGSITYRLERLE